MGDLALSAVVTSSLTQYHALSGAIIGVEVAEYLLEKSRVCHRGQLERNYHAFYYLLHGAESSVLAQCGMADLTLRRYLPASKQELSSTQQAQHKQAWDEVVLTELEPLLTLMHLFTTAVGNLQPLWL